MSHEGGVTVTCSDRKTKSEHGVEKEGKTEGGKKVDVNVWGDGCFTRDEQRRRWNGQEDTSCFCWPRMKGSNEFRCKAGSVKSFSISLLEEFRNIF